MKTIWKPCIWPTEAKTQRFNDNGWLNLCVYKNYKICAPKRMNTSGLDSISKPGHTLSQEGAGVTDPDSMHCACASAHVLLISLF